MDGMVAWTDGACSGNGTARSPGGWAVVFADGSSFSGGEPETTNQRMELRAAIEALARVPDGAVVEVRSDSAYVINCFKQRWHAGWERNGWRNSRGDAVANRDLWEQLLKLARTRRVTWSKVRGHAGDPRNEQADRLAVAAIPRS